MTGILASINNLIQSILGIFTSILNTIFSSVQGVFAVSGTLVQDLVNMFRGLLGFLMSAYSPVLCLRPELRDAGVWANFPFPSADNIIIIGVLVAGFVGYSAYQQKQHKTVTGKKQI